MHDLIESKITSSLLEIGLNKNWLKLELRFGIQPRGASRISGRIQLVDGNNLSVKIPNGYEISVLLTEYHHFTANKEESKWNTLNFLLTPDHKLEKTFLWDIERQDIVDEANLVRKKKKPNYILPKWIWQMDMKDILNELGIKASLATRSSDWSKSILEIRRTDNKVVVNSSRIKNDGTEVPNDFTTSLFIDNLINRLYRLSQEGFPRHKDWNKATFVLDISQKYEIEYFWEEGMELV